MPDLKLALRTLIASPLVNLVAVLSLSLGIGANGAIYSLFDQMLLRTLPVPESDRLVNLSAPGPKPGSQSCNQAGDCEDVFSYPMFRDLEREQTVLAGLAAHRAFGANLAYEGETLSGEGMYVSGSYFSTLGLAPSLGRLLDTGDERAVGESRVVVLSHDYWLSRFGQNPDVLNGVLVVNGQPLTIIGVGPPGFRGTTMGSRPRVFVPITLRGLLSGADGAFEDRRNYWAYLFGRLRPGGSLEEAKAALDIPYRALIREVEAPLQEGMSEQTLERFRDRELVVKPGGKGQSTFQDEARPPILLLFTVAGVVLLIACANVANLLLARGASRSGEMALRLSIGASRAKLVSQLLAEACLLSVVAAVASLAVAEATLRGMAALLPPEATATFVFSLDRTVVVFAGLLALATGALFGLFPALESTRVDLSSSLKGQSGRSGTSRAARRFRFGLVTAQIALSTTLLVSAGLFIRSLSNVSRVELGLNVDNVITVSISPQRNGYTPERSRQLFVEAETELAALPGVSSVTASLVPILTGDNWGTSAYVQGFEATPDTDIHSRYNEIGPGYFRTLGIPLLSGREFTESDAVGAPLVAIVNETFAEKFGLDRDAVGKRMDQSDKDELRMEIVGLVQDAKYSQVKGKVPPLFFTPYRQDERLGFITFYVRTQLAPESVIPQVSALLARLDPNLPVEDLKTMPQQVRENLFLDRFLTILSVSFAVVATLLASIGLYGVLAYTVAQRTREIGVRMALGADGPKVRALIFWQLARMLLVGGLVGVAAAVAIGVLARSLLFEVSGYDPVALVASVALLAVISMSSGLVPALRASRINPIRALHYE